MELKRKKQDIYISWTVVLFIVIYIRDVLWRNVKCFECLEKHYVHLVHYYSLLLLYKYCYCTFVNCNVVKRRILLNAEYWKTSFRGFTLMTPEDSQFYHSLSPSLFLVLLCVMTCMYVFFVFFLSFFFFFNLFMSLLRPNNPPHANATVCLVPILF